MVRKYTVFGWEIALRRRSRDRVRFYEIDTNKLKEYVEKEKPQEGLQVFLVFALSVIVFPTIMVVVAEYLIETMGGSVLLFLFLGHGIAIYWITQSYSLPAQLALRVAEMELARRDSNES